MIEFVNDFWKKRGKTLPICVPTQWMKITMDADIVIWAKPFKNCLFDLVFILFIVFILFSFLSADKKY